MGLLDIWFTLTMLIRCYYMYRWGEDPGWLVLIPRVVQDGVRPATKKTSPVVVEEKKPAELPKESVVEKKSIRSASTDKSSGKAAPAPGLVLKRGIIFDEAARRGDRKQGRTSPFPDWAVASSDSGKGKSAQPEKGQSGPDSPVSVMSVRAAARLTRGNDETENWFSEPAPVPALSPARARGEAKKKSDKAKNTEPPPTTQKLMEKLSAQKSSLSDSSASKKSSEKSDHSLGKSQLEEAKGPASPISLSDVDMLKSQKDLLSWMGPPM